jgi:aspergillopepsin I
LSGDTDLTISSWVFSSETPASERTGHSYYTPGSTAKKLSGYTWDISYGDGSSASGDVYTDTVTVGGVTYAKQAVESAKKVSSEFTDDTYSDGLLGLAFSSINTVSPTAQKTFFANVASSLASPLFAADLKHNAAGVYDFGWTDSSKYTGSITYTDVDSSQGFWQFTSTSYAINGKNANKALNGIADTGTTLLLIDDSIVSKYYAQVSGAKNSNTYGGWVFPCTATLPSFSLIIGSYSATVPGAYINYGAAEDTGTTCYGGIQSDDGIGFSIFGDIFLKSQYVVFDNSGPQIGFAAQSS